MKVQTVNVVEVEDFVIMSIQAFSDDEAGNREAEDAFRKLALEHKDPLDDEEIIEDSIEDGNYHNMDWCVYIEHSV